MNYGPKNADITSENTLTTASTATPRHASSIEGRLLPWCQVVVMREHVTRYWEKNVRKVGPDPVIDFGHRGPNPRGNDSVPDKRLINLAIICQLDISKLEVCAQGAIRLSHWETSAQWRGPVWGQGGKACVCRVLLRAFTRVGTRIAGTFCLCLSFIHIHFGVNP